MCGNFVIMVTSCSIPFYLNICRYCMSSERLKLTDRYSSAVLEQHNEQGGIKLQIRILNHMPMKHYFKILGIYAPVFLLVMILAAFMKTNQIHPVLQPGIPVVTTHEAWEITSGSATCGGVVTASGDKPVSARGICYNEVGNPTISDNKTNDGKGVGKFQSSLTGLKSNTIYYYCAYAVNSSGTGYGKVFSFKTPVGKGADLSRPSVRISGESVMKSRIANTPEVVTSAVTAIFPTRAFTGGTIPSDGGSQITEKGICWNTRPDPTVEHNKLVLGTGNRGFAAVMDGLTPNTGYYVRAYAISSAGIGYGNVLFFRTTRMPAASAVSDVDGNTYGSVVIGNHVWMSENLRTTRFNDGSPILLETDHAAWCSLTTPAYCWYNNDAGNKDIYGALYNWHTVYTHKLCPKGWHVPSQEEWSILVEYLGGSQVAGGKLKEQGTTHWLVKNEGATDEAGFRAVPGGYRSYQTSGAPFFGLYNSSQFWIDGELSPDGNSYFAGLDRLDTKIRIMRINSRMGYSIRCVKD